MNTANAINAMLAGGGIFVRVEVVPLLCMSSTLVGI
jgi:hypothetical protein